MMFLRSIFRITSAVCGMSLLLCFAPSYAQNATSAPISILPEIIQLPRVEVVGPSTFIKFRFPGKEKTTTIDIVEHFNNRVFRLFENENILYGLYSFEGDPIKDDKFTAHYMVLPKEEDGSVVYFRFDFDNKTRKFKEKTIMAGGKEILQDGTFELAPDVKVK